MDLQEYLNNEEEKHKQTIDIYKKWSGLPFKSLAHIDCDKMILFAEHYHKEQLALFSVSDQRELLIRFLTDIDYKELDKCNYIPNIPEVVDDYLKSNRHK